ncbi:sodium/calcium exchanger membrane region [Chthoniobacter flavus Ellin428]|uniref:Sodium/calcium exchanger membrane region n=1 Tax=Chthoniobacter flavus Ellin428 TaxID=497964 RepID=B4D1B2_9BACT|nr:ionic transporter y4hA [Chthoniobacter flavus]EDY19524.1 sodium/calcium exchanger membrane region [Chthoniobacter flavus Ellin428]TCO92769.1 Ca2+:H+ antiporter [Chthoniobacter flavus]
MKTTMPLWTWLVPVLALGALIAAGVTGVGTALAVLCGAALVGAVFAAVHHAEVVAHRLGEPLGTLVLALAVTAIETALILSMMAAGGQGMEVLARDSIYSAVMIICSGVVGLCLLVGGLFHREQTFRVEGAGAGLAALIVMAAMTLVLPTFTTSTPAGTYTESQLAFVAVSSAVLWAVYVFIQTKRHRDYFISENDETEAHAALPTVGQAWASFGLLLLSLGIVVGLAKKLSPIIEKTVEAAHAPRAVVGIVIAALVLLPETWAAVRAARANRLQNSMNLAVGSALATIGLTVPVVVVASIIFHLPLVLGLPSKEMALLAVTFLVSAVTLGTGRTYVMQGAVHLVLFAAYLFLAFVP